MFSVISIVFKMHRYKNDYQRLLVLIGLSNILRELCLYKLLMILQPQHQHQKAPQQPLGTQNTPNNLKQAGKPLIQPPQVQPSPNLHPQPPQILTQMLQTSLLLLSLKGANEIKQKIKYFEEKVHLSYSDGPNQYLAHLAAKISPENKQTLGELIDIQNWLAANSIRNGETNLHERGSIGHLKGQIANKLIDMKNSIMSLSSLDKKAESYIESLLQFKKNNYWQHQSQIQVKVKNFLTKMKRIQSEHKKRYEKSLMQQQSRLQASLQQQQKERQQARKRAYSVELQRQIRWRKQRQKVSEEQAKKKSQIETMLLKLNSNRKRKYQEMQQNFIKNVLEPLEEERERKLEEIKSQHQPIDQEELDEHAQKYQEYKESMIQEHKKKDQEWQDINIKLEQQLKELFHSKHHKDIQPRFYNSLKEGRLEARKKVKDYERSVLQHFKPAIDPLKRSKLQEHILDLQLKDDKNKRKVRLQDGSVVIQQRPEYNARRIGVQYLQKLKEANEGKPRKKDDRSASLLEMPTSSKPKRIDYLRENRPNLVLKKTMGEWKKVVVDSSYSPREKYQSIMQQAVVFQEKARQKEVQMRSYKKGEKALQLSAEMDRYYTESVSAKMVVLKDVILKE